MGHALPAAPIGFAAHAVIVTIEVRAIPRITTPYRRNPGGAGLRAVGKCPGTARGGRGETAARSVDVSRGGWSASMAVILTRFPVGVATLLVEPARMREHIGGQCQCEHAGCSQYDGISAPGIHAFPLSGNPAKGKASMVSRPPGLTLQRLPLNAGSPSGTAR